MTGMKYQTLVFGIKNNVIHVLLNIGIDRPEQTVYTQIRCHKLGHLIRVYTVCNSSSTILEIHVSNSKIDLFQILGQVR